MYNRPSQKAKGEFRLSAALNGSGMRVGPTGATCEEIGAARSPVFLHPINQEQKNLSPNTGPPRCGFL